MTQTYERNEGRLSDEEYMQLIRVRAKTWKGVKEWT